MVGPPGLEPGTKGLWVVRRQILWARDKTIFYVVFVHCLGVFSAVHNLFNLGWHLISAEHHRLFREKAFAAEDPQQKPDECALP